METPETGPSLINLHIAEYQALTTRQSYWMILQISLVPIIPIYLALAVDTWKRGTIPGRIILWATFAGLQLLGYLWAQAMVEYYTSVKYVECVLRPLIKDALKSNLFWGYEPHLSAHRHTTPLFWELFFPAIGVLLFVVISGLRYWRFDGGSVFWDLCGAVINLMLLVALWSHCVMAIRIRREWSACDKDIVELFDARLQEVFDKNVRHDRTTSADSNA
jgi:hypothetical protein